MIYLAKSWVIFSYRVFYFFLTSKIERWVKFSLIITALGRFGSIMEQRRSLFYLEGPFSNTFKLILELKLRFKIGRYATLGSFM